MLVYQCCEIRDFHYGIWQWLISFSLWFTVMAKVWFYSSEKSRLFPKQLLGIFYWNHLDWGHLSAWGSFVSALCIKNCWALHVKVGEALVSWVILPTVPGADRIYCIYMLMWFCRFTSEQVTPTVHAFPISLLEKRVWFSIHPPQRVSEQGNTKSFMKATQGRFMLTLDFLLENSSRVVSGTFSPCV